MINYKLALKAGLTMTDDEQLIGTRDEWEKYELLEKLADLEELKESEERYFR